ncbi:hypothetical protein [Clostridium lundense]|uniref:hypothetical protein n=1 Tax=Clostridium lundense TaxID=319475 RepID=UPI000485E5F5|nr:hypothetical protein [Clostridium lundense]
MKRFSILAIIITLFLSIACSDLNSKVKVEHFSGYKMYTESIQRLFNFTPDMGIEGDNISLKFKGDNKLINITYELWKNEKIFKTGEIIELPIDKGFQGNISIVLLFNTENANEDIKLFADIKNDKEGGGAKYINIPNFLCKSGKWWCYSDEKYGVAFNEPVVIYELAARKDAMDIVNTNNNKNMENPWWKLLVKLNIKDK